MTTTKNSEGSLNLKLGDLDVVTMVAFSSHKRIWGEVLGGDFFVNQSPPALFLSFISTGDQLAKTSATL